MVASTRVVVAALLLVLSSSCQAQYAVLKVKATAFDGTVQVNSTCAAYNSNFTNLPAAATEFFPAVSVSGRCPQATENYSGLAVVSPVDGCTAPWSQLQKAGAVMALFFSYTSTLAIPQFPSVTSPSEVYIPVLIVSQENGLSLTSSDYARIEVSAYVPSGRNRSYLSEIGLWVIAVLTVLLSGFYSAQPYQFLKNGLLFRNGSVLDTSISVQRKCPERVSRQAGVLTVMLFISIICSMLVILYYFYYPVVYVVIAVFGCGACCAVYFCLSPFVALLPILNTRIPPNRLPILRHQPDPKFFLTVGFSVVLVVWWVVERNSSCVWVLHNILGVCFIVFIISNMVEMDTWILVLLLVTMLFYDVFFVFISPYLFNGRNVMVQAATGGKGMSNVGSGGTSDGSVATSEMLPVLFNFPRLVLDELAVVCSHYTSSTYNYAFLGYGDVAIPGMLVAQSLVFDHRMWPLQRIRVYFLVAVCAYSFGLSLAFVALFVSDSPQPALLYIVPSLLVGLLSTAAIRGHFALYLQIRKDGHGKKMKPTRTSGKEVERPDETEWPLVDSTYESESYAEP